MYFTYMTKKFSIEKINNFNIFNNGRRKNMV